MINLIAVETPNGYYISEEVADRWMTPKDLSRLKFDGATPGKTFTQGWYSIPFYPKKVEEESKSHVENERYELIDESYLSPKIPAVIVAPPRDEDGNWTGEYSPLESMYAYKCDKKENTWDRVEFSIKIIVKLDFDVCQIKPFSKEAITGRGYQETDYETIGPNALTRQLADKMMFPAIVHRALPCALTSHQVFDIIRAFVKRNIDSKWAEITSDYGFHFQVSKNLKLADPYTVEYQASSRRRNTRKEYVTYRKAVVLDISHASEPWKNGDCVQGITASNEEELSDMVDALLAKIIQKINDPLIECPHCKATGVIVDPDWNIVR
jgi:hypothetical protein